MLWSMRSSVSIRAQKGLTLHPRPDHRHATSEDVISSSQLCKNRQVEFNIEGNPFSMPSEPFKGFVNLVKECQPDQITLVPDLPNQITSDHGWEPGSGEALEPIIKRLQDQGMRVSLFMDPDPDQIELAAQIGTDRIELYTGPYAEAWGTDQLQAIFQQHLAAAELATELGMGVNAGHDLNLHNLAKFASIPGLLEVSIGHAFTVDSLAMGMVNAVRAYKELLA